MQNRKISTRVASIIIVATIFFFLGRNLYQNWSNISHYHWNFNYAYLILSILMFYILHTILASGWLLILRRLGVNLRFKKGLKINLLSLLGKYVPGKVWMVVGKVYLCSKEGIPKQTAFTSAVLENALIMISGIFITSIFILRSGIVQFNQYLIPSFAIIIIGLVVVHPTIFVRILNWISRKIKMQPAKVELRYGHILLFLGFYLVYWAFHGLAFYLFLNSLHTFSLSKIFDTTGVVVSSNLLGFFAVFAPAGLGVREGVMALLLGYYVPLPVAIMLSLACRFWATICELSIIGGVKIAVR